MRVLYVRALSAVAVLLIVSSASAVTMAWTPIGNPGNPADANGYLSADGHAYCGEYLNHLCGSVPYTYSIGHLRRANSCSVSAVTSLPMSPATTIASN